jgi:hypothetical protein
MLLSLRLACGSLDQLPNRFRRLGSMSEPVIEPLSVNRHGCRLLQRIIVADDVHTFAIAL